VIFIRITHAITLNAISFEKNLSSNIRINISINIAYDIDLLISITDWATNKINKKHEQIKAVYA
jgi:hypothetical protein